MCLSWNVGGWISNSSKLGVGIGFRALSLAHLYIKLCIIIALSIRGYQSTLEILNITQQERGQDWSLESNSTLNCGFYGGGQAGSVWIARSESAAVVLDPNLEGDCFLVPAQMEPDHASILSQQADVAENGDLPINVSNHLVAEFLSMVQNSAWWLRESCGEDLMRYNFSHFYRFLLEFYRVLLVSSLLNDIGISRLVGPPWNSLSPGW